MAFGATLDRLSKLGDTSIYAYCDPCRRCEWIDTDRLMALYGDLLLSSVKRCVTCKKCGKRNREIRLVHNGRPAA